jgi:hypothetical protein
VGLHYFASSALRCSASTSRCLGGSEEGVDGILRGYVGRELARCVSTRARATSKDLGTYERASTRTGGRGASFLFFSFLCVFVLIK